MKETLFHKKFVWGVYADGRKSPVATFFDWGQAIRLAMWIQMNVQGARVHMVHMVKS